MMRDRVRVIGVDFDTSVSQWGNSCPTECFQTSLVDRSEEILNKLKRSGVGQRPVVFVGHSMGGELKYYPRKARTEHLLIKTNSFFASYIYSNIVFVLDIKLKNQSKTYALYSCAHIFTAISSNTMKLFSLLKYSRLLSFLF